jgi:hypothetical protein
MHLINNLIWDAALSLLFDPEDGGSTFLQNIIVHVLN